MVNTPLQLAEALALFIRVEDLDRDLLIAAHVNPYYSAFDAEHPSGPELRLHFKNAERALALAKKYSLVDEPILSPAVAPTHLHHLHSGEWHGVRIMLETVEPLPVEPATDPGDDLAALNDDEGEPA